LIKLENEGLYTSVTRGRIKLYALNKKYPLFQELKKIVFKTEGVEGRLSQIVREYKGISLAFIYGSYAKNMEKKTSDIDLVVVGEVPNGKFARDIRALEARLNREINYTVYERGEFEKERKKQGGFLQLVLTDKIILLKGELRA
jgi:predicted nucleotidyltransferase